MNLIPDILKDLIISIIVAVIFGIIMWIWNYFKEMSKIQLPVWIFVLLITYIFMSILFFALNVFEKKSLTTVVDKVYGTEKVVLDGKKFINCTFNRTELIIKGQKPFVLGNNKFNNVFFKFDGNASLTFDVLRKMKNDPAFKPLLDGIFKDFGYINPDTSGYIK